MEATWQIVIYQFKWFIIETIYLEFAINKECGRQPKAFDRSITNAPNAVPWSTLCFHISVSAIRQCWTQCFFLNLHWYLEKISSKNLEICWHKDLSKFFWEIRQNTDWTIFVFVTSVTFLLHRSKVYHFQTRGKLTYL